jgi:phage terminase small subunit
MAKHRTSPKIKSHSDAQSKPNDSRREVFVRRYLIHQNASRAYREAGYKNGPGTRQSAHRLLTFADIQARISEEREKHMALLDVNVEHVFRRFRDIAFSDIAEIVGVHSGACRYCHGIDHAYQWRTHEEYETSRRKAGKLGLTAPVEEEPPAGGYGYNCNLLPDPGCPECDGDGITSIWFKDTRLLTNAERAVFAGVEETRYGTNYRFHNQMTALKELGKRVGFYDPPRNRETNTVASLIHELQSRGQTQGIQLRRDREQNA